MANKYFVSTILFLVVLFFGQAAFAQGADEMLVENADIQYGFGSKRDAGEIYRNAVEINPSNVRANYMAGICYLETITKEKALKYLLKAYELDPNVSPDILNLIATAYHLGEKFDKAIAFYEYYKEDVKVKTGTVYNRDKANRIISETNKKINECKNGKDLLRKPVYVKIESVGTGINSEDPEYAPAINRDETIMIFTGRRDPNMSPLKDRDNMFFEDMYISRKVGNEWSPLENLSVINSPYHEASISLSADGKQLLLYKDENAGDIYVSNQLKDGKWSTPKSIGNNVNTEFKESSASISPDGKLLFFSSDRPGGQGGMDIYVSPLLSGNKWGAPTNLGPKINTEFNDESPVLDYDGKTLYFSSKGHKGMGGYDIFKSEFDSTRNEWTEPVNLGYPINTPDNDTYFVTTADGKRAYYASVKDHLGVGDLDIFMLSEPKNAADSLLALQQMKKKPDPAANEIKALEELIASRMGKPAPNEDQLVQATPPPAPAKPAPAPVQQAVASNQPAPAPVKEAPKPAPKAELPVKAAVAAEPVAKAEPVSKPVAPVKEAPVAPAKPVVQPITFKVTVTDQEGNLIDATVQLSEATTNAPVALAPVEKGRYSGSLTDLKQKRYNLSVEKEGYMFRNIPVAAPAATVNPQELSREVVLARVSDSRGVKTILRNIYFDFDRVTLKSESFPELAKLERMLKENGSIVVEIAGHTDKLGSTAYNNALSQKRAEAIVKYLISKGIEPERLKPVGYGAQRPLASNDDEQDGRELNRRSEFEIISQ
jgi:outer membrane protein OmpA-like peptidoglycan-associated protein